MSIDKIINTLSSIRVDLDEFKKKRAFQENKALLEDILNRNDIIGCELIQNIAKKLKQK